MKSLFVYNMVCWGAGIYFFLVLRVFRFGPGWNLLERELWLVYPLQLFRLKLFHSLPTLGSYVSLPTIQIFAFSQLQMRFLKF